MVDRTSKVMGLSIDYHEHLVQMPLPIGMSVHLLDAFFTNLGRENRAKPSPPKPNCLVTDIDASLVQQVFNISKRKRKTLVHHHCQANDLGRRFEVTKRGAFCRPQTLRNRPALFKPVSSDSAAETVEQRRCAAQYNHPDEPKSLLV
jgi:hypothetical protein